MQSCQAVGFFSTDIPDGSRYLSCFGVEEAVVDGVFLLTSMQEGLERRRYLEVYKLRNNARLKGRHSMVIGKGGDAICPRYEAEAELSGPRPVASERARLRVGARFDGPRSPPPPDGALAPPARAGLRARRAGARRRAEW